MADKRINALANTASSTASDDFIAVDGTTNGTRKLNAFSPTFGGNATVTGTLTVNGIATVSAGAVIGEGTFGAGKIYTSATGGLSLGAKTGSSYDFILATPSGANLIAYVPTGTDRLVVPSTTASTTTSTGALVVGNGTSGGLGVGGALNVGGAIRAQLGLFAGSSPAGLASAYQVDVDAGTSRDILSWGDSSRVGLIRGEQDGSGRATLKFGRYAASTFAEYFRVTGLAATDAIVNIYGTTASTTTSSGALVVSGGVGVAGAVNCGSGLVANPLFTQTRKLEAQIPHTVSTEDYLRIGSNTGSTNTYAGEFGYGLTAGGSPQIRFNRVHAGTVTTWLTVPTSTGDAEFAGSVKTGAPSGGTAAAWKLGTVATVSPTSPNRTIEVDIGGTIYYLAAKTTNN